MKQWILIGEECQTCGSEILIYSEAEQPTERYSYSAYDSDEAKCSDIDCKEHGQMVVCEELCYYEPNEALADG